MVAAFAEARAVRLGSTDGLLCPAHNGPEEPITTPRKDLKVTPERWEKLKELFDAALERPPGERPAFLAKACEGNQSLSDDIQRLLAENDQIGSFLEPAAWIKGAILNPAAESALPLGARTCTDGEVLAKAT